MESIKPEMFSVNVPIPDIYIYTYILPLRKATGVVESFGRLIIFYIGLKCHFNYFVQHIYIYIYIPKHFLYV